MATATVSYTAEIADLRKQLASVTDVTRAEAKKWVSDLNKTVKAAESTQTKAAKAFKGTAKATS